MAPPEFVRSCRTDAPPPGVCFREAGPRAVRTLSFNVQTLAAISPHAWVPTPCLLSPSEDRGTFRGQFRNRTVHAFRIARRSAGMWRGARPPGGANPLCAQHVLPVDGPAAQSPCARPR